MVAAARHLPAAGVEVRGVRIAVGAATGIVPGALELAFRAAAVETRFAAARLIIERVAARSRCSQCGRVYEFDDLIGRCPACGAPGGELLAGDGLELRAIEVRDV